MLLFSDSRAGDHPTPTQKGTLSSSTEWERCADKLELLDGLG